ncbi:MULTISPECIES: hypothetical protein [Pseudomonas]|uniref:Uncharacterized protein n=1 Tax=Pseudomonas orientalis TaxID=76758 RepID=A0A4Q7CXE5_9PSED|nr:MULTISPECIES: hypothetical protein [Pseudomonas]RZI31016.1 hypothetical protein EUX57_14240 [Pseudomonas orientalis]
MSDDFRPFTAVEVGNHLDYIRLKIWVKLFKPCHLCMRYRLDRNSIVLSRSAFDYYKNPASTLKNIIYQDHKIKIIVMVFSSDTVIAPTLLGQPINNFRELYGRIT